jgi:hypothetical protein
MTKRVLFVAVDSGQGQARRVKVGIHARQPSRASTILAPWPLGALQKPDGGKVE